MKFFDEPILEVSILVTEAVAGDVAGGVEDVTSGFSNDN